MTDQVEVAPSSAPGADEVLTPDAVAFVADLQRLFRTRRDELLQARRERYAEIVRTGRLDFLDSTAELRAADWTVAECPPDLRDRRVEITGPTDPKMAINALNSGAKIWLADLEDANTPHWANVVTGQVVLRHVARRDLTYTSPDGSDYRLRTDQPLAVPLVRPRGWHLDERHVIVDGQPSVAALVDFGLFFFHNARELIERGSGPYFYLPKMESHLEARLWRDVFDHSEQALGIPRGSVRATVLIETIPAAFEMEEILYELRDYASGLNAGRWDYLFSIIKNFRECGASYVLPDRNVVGMTSPFMRAYTETLVTTCHRRGAFAIGGMSAFIPNSRSPEVTAAALEKVRQDKEREANDGFDGSWVAHPALVPVCQEVFDGVLGEAANQLERRRERVDVTAEELLDLAATPGARTMDGLRNAVAVGLRYIGAWLGGTGAVAIFNLMEDAATAEIARSQIWQWLHNGVELQSGERVDLALVQRIIEEEHGTILDDIGDPHGYYAQARELFERLTLDASFVDFLTVAAYELVD